MEELKKEAAEKAVEYIKDGMVVGLGTGSTAIYAIKKIAELNLDIIGIATSKETERIAKKLGIKLSNLDEVGKIDITIDGADEIDKNLNLIKGRGGALVREKIVAMHTKNEIIVADSSKLVKKLGEKCALPIEIIRFAPFSIAKRIEEKFGCKTGLRK
ncbi:MAG: ribose 5-phosphate isomerase A, partial [Candidatus Thermoplasmatota archaeon]